MNDVAKNAGAMRDLSSRFVCTTTLLMDIEGCRSDPLLFASKLIVLQVLRDASVLTWWLLLLFSGHELAVVF